MRWRHRLHSCVAQTQTHSQLKAYTQALVAIPETTTTTALCNVILGLKRHQHTEMVLYTPIRCLYTYDQRAPTQRRGKETKKKKWKISFSSWKLLLSLSSLWPAPYGEPAAAVVVAEKKVI